MFKTTKKTMALMMALAMVLTLFAGVAQASGDVTITASSRDIVQDGTGAPGIINIRQDDSPVLDQDDITKVTITLPEGIEWVSEPDLADIELTVGGLRDAVQDEDISIGELEDGNRTVKFTIDLDGDTPDDTDIVTAIRFAGLDIDAEDEDFEGPVKAEVEVVAENADGVELWTETAEVTIANIVGKGTSASATPLQVTRGQRGQEIGEIEIEENIAGSLTNGGIIVLELPSGVTWASVDAIIDATPDVDLVATFDGRTAYITLEPYAGKITLKINGTINVGLGVSDGPIEVRIEDHDTVSNVSEEEVNIATVGVVGVLTPSAVYDDDMPSVTAGRMGEETAGIKLTENAVDAFRPNRALELVLPVGFTWNEVEPGNWAEDWNTANNGRTLVIWTGDGGADEDLGDEDGETEEFEIEGIKINANINAPTGPIVVTVGGTTGASGTVTIGTLRKPVTVTAVTVPTVQTGALDQRLGNIVITENFAGAFMDGYLVITPPTGIGFVGEASATVANVAGSEAEIDSIETHPGGIVIELTAGDDPDNASSITITGIEADLWRDFAGTQLIVEVTGSAILETNFHDDDDDNDYAEIEDDDADTGLANMEEDEVRGTRVATVAVGSRVTRQARRTVFTVDSTAYTVDGVTQTLDVAPVIQEGRTMMPIRAAANAAGVTNENIMFEAGVITIIRGDRVAQFTLGSRVMVVNGVAMNMDAAPALVAGRALIPVRWVGTALGVPVNWDPAVRTVTVTVE